MSRKKESKKKDIEIEKGTYDCGRIVGTEVQEERKLKNKKRRARERSKGGEKNVEREKEKVKTIRQESVQEKESEESKRI